jgi:pyruvate/2-oxoglutarate/acetoin dehydrogenase E1 component
VPEAWFVRTPGLKVVAPSTPADAKGLLLAAIRDNNPVVYLEAKGLYGIFSPERAGNVPLGDVEVEIGKGAIRRAGRDISVLTYGPMVYAALAAAESLAGEGIELEVVDLRSLVPLDEEPGPLLGRENPPGDRASRRFEAGRGRRRNRGDPRREGDLRPRGAI